MMITKGKIEKTAKKMKKKKKSEQNFPGRSYSAPKLVRELLSISNSGPGQIENNSYFVIRARDLFVLVERPRLPIDHLETL